MLVNEAKPGKGYRMTQINNAKFKSGDLVYIKPITDYTTKQLKDWDNIFNIYVHRNLFGRHHTITRSKIGNNGRVVYYINNSGNDWVWPEEIFAEELSDLNESLKLKLKPYNTFDDLSKDL